MSDSAKKKQTKQKKLMIFSILQLIRLWNVIVCLKIVKNTTRLHFCKATVHGLASSQAALLNYCVIIAILG